LTPRNQGLAGNLSWLTDGVWLSPASAVIDRDGSALLPPVPPFHGDTGPACRFAGSPAFPVAPAHDSNPSAAHRRTRRAPSMRRSTTCGMRISQSPLRSPGLAVGVGVALVHNSEVVIA